MVAAIAIGWHHGRASAPLFGVDWSRQWSEPLAEIRRRFAIDEAQVEAARTLAAPSIAGDTIDRAA